MRLCDYPGCNRTATRIATGKGKNTPEKEWFSCDEHRWSMPDRPIQPLAIVDGRTPEQLAEDGDDYWPDGRRYVPAPLSEGDNE